MKEYLEEQMDLKRICAIRFIGDNGGLATIRARITHLYSRDSRDYLKTEEGLEISFDKITGINDRSFNPTC
jgi:hypothetical protein